MTGFPVVTCWYFDVVLLLGLIKSRQLCPSVTMWEMLLAVELEEPVDNPGTAIGTQFFRVAWDFLSFLMRCGS